MGLGDLAGLMGKMKDMQSNMQQMQQELGQKRVSADSGGGMVHATVDGKGELVEIKIDPQVVTGDDVEMLEDLVVAAVNAATDKSREVMQQEMQKMTGGLNLPGMDQLGSLLG